MSAVSPDTTLANAGLPKISDVYSNVNIPTSLNDIGGSAATEAGTVNSGVNDAFKTYVSQAQSQQKPLDIYNQLEQQNGIPQLRATSNSLQGNVSDLENALTRVEPNVNNNTANSMATESQREGLIQAGKYPLEQQLTPQMTALGRVQQGLTNAEANVGTVTGLVNQGNQQMLNVYGMGVTVAQDNAARTMTGFTTDQQNQLQMLLAKAQAQEHMDDSEWQTLSTLAGKQQDYKNAIGQLNAQSQKNLQSIGANGSIYYDSNGKPITVGSGNSASSQSSIGGSGGSGSWSIVP